MRGPGHKWDLVPATSCVQNGGRSTGVGDSVPDATSQLSQDKCIDDLGTLVPVPAVVRRVVSLVPSLTETVASLDPGLLAGATDWCSHPAELAVTRVGGTKNPKVDAVIDLAPDVVLANEEENRPSDLQALRAAGLAVWVTRIRDLPSALASLRRMITLACRRPSPAWLETAEQGWHGLPASLAGAAIIPIWRRPWMVLGSDTFGGDLLARLGVSNIYSDHADRYPRVDIGELQECGADLVVLPDEPYRFTACDGPEAFPGSRTALVSGRHLTWYGPSLVEAPFVLARQLRSARVR
jgi:ABC-type Fe3+-hydroxamate transport system substrate-binding protein